MTRDRRIGRVGMLSAALLLLAAPALRTRADVPSAGAEGVAFFEAKVRPVLVEHCSRCHAAGLKNPKGGLRIESRAALLGGGDNGPAVVPGKPDESLLIQALGYASPDLRMPPKGKLPYAVVADLAAWVEMGAPWPEGPAAQPAASSPDGFDLEGRRRAHWAWRPIRATEPPEVRRRDWPRGPIDRFLLARLEAEGLTPAPPADPRTLIRRVTFDLTGLPPTPGEVEAFVRDDSPRAFEAVVDRLLASPHFGERWARHWLDLVRYAETRGHEFDAPIPNAWQYRDYVIRALNADVPYDRFVAEQIAGDLIPEPRLHPDRGFNESILGTGFWLLGEEVHSPVDTRKDETDRLDNRLDVMTKTFLGLTVACARCHDHKFDAIGQDDYYALTGFLLGASYRQAPFEHLEHNRTVAEELNRLRRVEGARLLQEVARASAPTVDRLAETLLAARAADAESRSLDAARVAAWAQELREARCRPGHPLHAFARLADDPDTDDPTPFALRLKALLDPEDEDDSPAAPPRMILDYTRTDPPPLASDGFAFGLRPMRAGDVVLGRDPERPIREVVGLGAARTDPAWQGLALADTVERDHGRLGTWDRPGRTIRTPTVDLESGNLYYLVRGAGRAYASVDSHLLVAGPLHGRVLREWDAPADEWRWVRHDLTPYKGHRVHIEFSPRTADADLAIAQVVESATRPPLPESAATPLRRAAGATQVVDLAGLAGAYQDAFAEALRAMAAGDLASSDRPAGVAALADWIARRDDLFLAPGGRERVAAAARVVLSRRDERVGRIKDRSEVAPALFEGNGVDEHLLIRGSHKAPGGLVPRRFLAALGGADPGGYGPGSGRLQLARQILDEDDPFPARVLVNRVWHHLFGRGIVATVDNFGVLGERPSHPELLDWLAGRFRTDLRWSLKRLIRAVVLSSAYRMSGAVDPRAAAADPLDVLLHHMPIRRLEGEAIRDAILAVSGRLDRTALGPPVEVYLTPFMDGRGRPATGGPLDGGGRRSLYTKVRRNFLSPMMLAFDTPIPFSTVGRRNLSNVPAQALILMNDPFVIEQARHWGRRVAAAPGTREERVSAMYLAAFARAPRAEERDDALAFLDRQASLLAIPPERRDDHPDVWAELAHVLFNVKEFVFLR